MTIDWKPYLVGGATRPDSITGLDPAFQNSLAQLFLNAPPEIQAQLRLTSGFRSPERQEQLWQEALVKYGSPEAARKWVAPPGRSKHNHGQAVDLKYLGGDAKAWAHANAERYGLHFPMAHEPWHIEPAGSRGGSVPKAPSVIDMATSGGGQAVMTGGAGDDTMQTERRGFLGRMFGDMDPERRDKLIVALEGMTHNPNQALMDQAQGRIDERRIDARTAAQVNKTVEYLRANGSGDLADAVASGVFDPGQAVTQHYSRAEAGQAQATEAARREQAAAYADQYGRADVAAAIRSGVIGPEEGGKMILTGEKVTPTDDMREYDFAKSQGYSGTFQQYQTEMKRAGAGSTVIGGQQDPQWGNAPNDHVWLRNEAGQVITEADPSGRGVRPVAVPVSGSKAATEAAEAERTAGNSAGMRDTATDTIVTAAQRAREAASKRAFGGYGQVVAEYIPWTDSAEVSRQTEVLKSTAKVENLTAMRMASPTGGALGSVTENESKMLAAKSGALDPSSPNFLRDLDDYERTLLQVIHGYEAGNAIYEQTRREKAGGTTVRRFNPETGKLE